MNHTPVRNGLRTEACISGKTIRTGARRERRERSSSGNLCGLGELLLDCFGCGPDWDLLGCAETQTVTKWEVENWPKGSRRHAHKLPTRGAAALVFPRDLGAHGHDKTASRAPLTPTLSRKARDTAFRISIAVFMPAPLTPALSQGARENAAAVTKGFFRHQIPDLRHRCVCNPMCHRAGELWRRR